MKKIGRLISVFLIGLLVASYIFIEKRPEGQSIVSTQILDINKPIDTFTIFTQPSDLANEYIGFSSPSAINRVAEIENEYFNSYPNSYSQYYGTQWHKKLFLNGDSMLFKNYVSELHKIGKEPKALHCTHYAIESLKAGLDSNFSKMDQYHKEIWKDREYAGWSVGYILTKHFGWKAYLVVSDLSKEKSYCLKNFEKDKKYNVWYQPDIPLERLYDFEEEKEAIDSLLLQHEYGWGFSNQGWHTWITRFDTLKECYWDGIPSDKLNPEQLNPLFLKTKFTEFADYHSHILIFPPKK